MNESAEQLSNLSQFIDDELDVIQSDEVLEMLAADPRARDLFTSSLLMRDVLQGQYAADQGRALRARLSRAIAGEDALAPQAVEPATAGGRGNDSDMPKMVDFTGPDPFDADAKVTELKVAELNARRVTWVASGFALAASIALAAVLVFVPHGGPEFDRFRGTRAAPGVANHAAEDLANLRSEPAEGTRRVQQEQRLAIQTAAVRWNVTGEVEQRLNGYLLNHSEYLSGSARGMLPYARIVGYGQNSQFK